MDHCSLVLFTSHVRATDHSLFASEAGTYSSGTAVAGSISYDRSAALRVATQAMCHPTLMGMMHSLIINRESITELLSETHLSCLCFCTNARYCKAVPIILLLNRPLDSPASQQPYPHPRSSKISSYRPTAHQKAHY